MKKERKICICLTPRQVIGSVLLAVSAVNLIIVGTAFEMAFPGPVPTNSATPTAITATMTSLPTTSTAQSTFIATVTPTDTMTPTGTSTSTPTDTATVTPTSTFIPSPVPTQCIPRYDWPVYKIQRGATLSWLAQATGSSVYELMLANCLPDSQIFAGQLIHVPRLPLLPTTAAPMVIPSDTPSSTPAPPANSPTVIKPNIMTCDGPGYAAFSASVYDEDGLVSVYVTLYSSLGEAIAKIPMDPDGITYYGSAYFSKEFTAYDVGYYTFRVVDKLQEVTNSQPYYDRAANCVPIPTDTPTDIPVG